MSHYDDSESAPFAPRHYHRDENGQILFAGNGKGHSKEPKPMSDTPTFAVMNPLAETISEGESLIERIRIASEHLESCIADERAWYANVKEAEATYEIAETEALAEAVILAQAKEGPLGGIAATSKAYDILLTKLKNDLRAGKLQRQWQSLERIRRSYELSLVDLRQAETQFASLRKAVELKAAVLRAAAL
jgi:hypothetical protein